ncbi:TPA: ead/Ea22-like family protein [Escherichia coli]
MSKIDYQALREAAEKATWGDWDSYKPHRGARGYEVRLSSQAIAQHVLKNNAEFIAAFNPKVALALLDERERNQQYIKRRDQENEMMVDAMHAAIALTSVGIDLDDYDECVLRLHEWGVLPDYCIALYVDFVHGIVSKNKLLDFGYINGAPVWTLRDELEAAKSKLNEQREYYEGVIADGSKRMAELEAREIKPAKGEVLVVVSGFTGCGKSAIAGEIDIAMKAIGVPVQWTNGDAEKRMTGADWLTAIEMYKPTVRIVEVNVPRTAGIRIKGE